MKVLDAVLAQIEPYDCSDAAIEVALAWASLTLDKDAQVTQGCDDYSVQTMRIIALAAMRLLADSASLSSENVAGVSKSYSSEDTIRRVKALARANALSPYLVLSEDTDATVGYISVM